MTNLGYRPAALILAPFEEKILEELQDNLNITYENWIETRVIHDQDSLKNKLSNNGTEILVIESDFVQENHCNPYQSFQRALSGGKTVLRSLT